MTEIFPTNGSKPEDFAIVARGLSKKFGDEFAVRDLTFELPKRTIMGFIGPSGSGKTTAIRLLTGIYQPTGGEAFVLGMHPKEFNSEMRERIGYLPQLFVLFQDLSIWENMNFAASLYGLGFFRRGRRIKEILDYVELYQHRHKLARQISGGMQRRLSLAATLIHGPELVFLDEPTAGIDPVLRRKLWDHFQHLKEEGATLFVTTQYVGEAAYCDLVGILANGRIIMVETPDGLRRRAYGGDVIDVKTNNAIGWDIINQIRQLPFVLGNVDVKPDNTFRLTVDEANTAIPQLLKWFEDKDIPVETANEYLPPFDDVFVQIIQEEVANEEAA